MTKTLTGKRGNGRKELISELLQKIEYLSNNPTGDAVEEHEQIEALLGRIIDFEKDITVPLPQRDDKWNDFTNWCIAQGVPMDKFEVKSVGGSGEYGLFAKCPFARNDEVLRVPRKMFLTHETAMADAKLAPIVKDVIFAHLPNVVLAIHLMTEYNKAASFWAPYLRTLPTTYSTVLYLNQAELLQLRGSPLLEEVVKIKRNVARQYAYLFMKVDTLPKGKNRPNPLGTFTYELFRWALSTVMTRQNSVPSQSDDSKWTLALIPLWDLCNHRQGNLCTDFDTSTQTLVFYSMADLTAGAEIFNHYGNRSNAEFFLHNGFVYDDHPADSMRLKLGFSTSDPLYSLKDALAKKIALNTTASFELAHKSAPRNAQLLAFVRIFHLDKDQLEKWLSAEKPQTLLEDTAELAHLDEKVAQFLKMRCTLLLRKYPAVEQQYLNANVEAMIKCEKRILQSYVD